MPIKLTEEAKAGILAEHQAHLEKIEALAKEVASAPSCADSLSKEQKNERGKLWVTDDDGVTRWFNSLDAVLLWMKDNDPENYNAIMMRRLYQMERTTIEAEMVVTMNDDLSLYEKDMISQIAKRARAWYCAHMPLGAEPKLWELEAEIQMAHSVQPLRLRELLIADDFNFVHDIIGIRIHLNRTTGRLRDCFVPRFAA